MKGGITSGVVYPRAVAAFAERYRLRRVGGTSAGAIAAAAAAAAQLGRDRGGNSFDELRVLPERLGSPVAGDEGGPSLEAGFAQDVAFDGTLQFTGVYRVGERAPAPG